MEHPRPADFLRSEVLRLRDLRASGRWTDPAVARTMRARIDARIDALLDELATTTAAR